MLDFLETAVATGAITIPVMAMMVACALVMGLAIALTYMKTSENSYSKNFATTLLLLPVLMSIIILLIGNNVAGAFSLAGIFSVIRFRSAPGSSRDIVYILFCVGVGLACGVLEFMYGAIFTVILCLLLLVLHFIGFASRDSNTMRLKILVPEDLNSEDAFDDLLKEYTNGFELTQVKTKDLGSVYELGYVVKIKKKSQKIKMIDDLRCRNGNLMITLSTLSIEEEF
ncbi:MAG: DUF4956 domain-containing protein [Anaerorhabdus sp.]